jgi:2-polyprenyl-3-methyl-5-hydroxy-6-metoxy-1,4-benzoquinol methylase
MKNEIYKSLLRVVLRLHNSSYKLAGKLAIKAEGGLHSKHRLMNYHRFFIENIKEGDGVLDIGCGNGALAFDIAKKAKKVIGVDFDGKNIKIAKEKYSAPNIEYIVGDATKYDFDQKFHVIILSNILEHIENRIGFLKKIRKLAPKILIRVPMINRDWITLHKKELGVFYKLDKTHYVEYTLESFKDEIEKARYKIKNYSIQFGEIWAVLY